jgi:hypothetical protein
MAAAKMVAGHESGPLLTAPNRLGKVSGELKKA